MKVYLYKKYNESLAYGDEEITIYESIDDAKEQLRTDVEEKFNLPWSLIPNKLYFADEDTFMEDYVSYDDGNGCSYWCIEEKKIIKSSK